MGLIYKVKFQESFKDGNVYPRFVKAGEVIELDEDVVNRVRQSGGVVEVIEKRVPKQKAVKDEE